MVTLDQIQEVEKSLQAGCNMRQATEAIGCTVGEFEKAYKELLPNSNLKQWVKTNQEFGKVLLTKARYKTAVKGNLEAIKTFDKPKFYNRTILPSSRDNIINLM